MSDQDFQPDLGKPKKLSAPLDDGMRSRAEQSFIKMLRAAFEGHDTFPYHDDREQGRLGIRSALSNKDQSYLPRIEVRVGPISEYEGAIGNLNKWSRAVRRHMYADQAQVMFVVTAEEAAEANDIGDRVRRLIDLARADLGRRGIFGMLKPKMQPPKSARKGSQEDDVYQAAVQAAFIMIERQERVQSPADPLLDSVSGVETYEAPTLEASGPGGEATNDGTSSSGVGGEFSGTEKSGDSPASPTLFTVDRVDSTSVFGTLTFSKQMGTYQVDGLTATVGQSEKEPGVVRDSTNFYDLIVELGDIRTGVPVTVEYAPGNLKDAQGRDVPAFGPVEGEWATQ